MDTNENTVVTENGEATTATENGEVTNEAAENTAVTGEAAKATSAPRSAGTRTYLNTTLVQGPGAAFIKRPKLKAIVDSFDKEEPRSVDTALDTTIAALPNLSAKGFKEDPKKYLSGYLSALIGAEALAVVDQGSAPAKPAAPAAEPAAEAGEGAEPAAEASEGGKGRGKGRGKKAEETAPAAEAGAAESA